MIRFRVVPLPGAYGLEEIIGGAVLQGCPGIIKILAALRGSWF
jgi:hypothetical protein